MWRLVIITISLVTCCFTNPQNIYADESPATILESFISSNDLKAYKQITQNQNLYRDLVLQQLKQYSKGKERAESLIYLATFIKDQRYIEPLVAILQNQYSQEYSCLYNCPIVLSLAVYHVYTTFKVPINKLGGSSAADVIKSRIEWLTSNDLVPEEASKRVDIADPQNASILKSVQELPYEQVLKIALEGSPQENNFWKHKSATWVLEYSTNTSKYLPELYWLAITAPSDASDSYREAFYWAIYRAEQARIKKNT